VADPHDPAIGLIQDLSRQFPDRRIEVFVCECSPDGNSKVQRLERLAREARYDTLLVNDSDVCVGPHYLRTVVGPLADPATGLVTCLYRARPGGTLPSLLEALWISAEFQAQVLLARAFQGARFALGATMALRRRDLERIGGFAALRPYLADDYQLGSRIAGLRLKVVVSPYVVEIQHPPDGWRDVWRRQLRWSRTVRASRPRGHTGLLMTHGTVWSLLALGLASAAGHRMLALASLACLGLRLGAAWFVGWKRLGSRQVRRYLLLMPLADLLSFGAWLGSFFTNVVYWRGRRRVITGSGTLERVGTPLPERSGSHSQTLSDR
jgi:ceramide glucosyltransferase